MMQASLKAITVAALIGVGMLSLPSSAKAGWGCGGWGCGWGPALVGLGVGTVIGSALFAPRVYAAPPPVYADYGPPAWTPEWYTYCAQRYRSFNSHTGYFTGYDGQPYFCQ
jgi:BA14K-like protein